MQAVFLDQSTFLDEVDLPAPAGVSDYVTYPSTPADAELIVQRCQNADIVITNKVVMSAPIIARLPQLKLIQLTATGINNVDQTACQQHGVTLYNVAGYAKQSVAEHTFMLMLMAMRSGVHYHQSVCDGRWQQANHFSLLDIPLIDLADKTLGIIGVGDIGTRVGELAQAFGMSVLWAERQGRTPRGEPYLPFADVLAQADVLSLHCPLTADTQQLINPQSIALMHKRPVIVNVARGGIVDSQAISEALQQGQVQGYATDVFAHEPIKDTDPLLGMANHPRVIFSPHNAWGSVSAQRNLWQRLSQQVSQFIASAS